MISHFTRIMLVLIGLSLFTGAVFAGTITVGSVSDAQVQQKITIPVTITGAEDVVSFGLTVANDVPGVSITVNKNAEPLGGMYVPTNNESAVFQRMGWLYDGETPLSGDAVLYYIDVVSSVSGTIPVKLTIDSVDKSPVTDVSALYTPVSGTITVQGQSSGDTTDSSSSYVSVPTSVPSQATSSSSSNPVTSGSSTVVQTSATVTATRVPVATSTTMVESVTSAASTVPTMPTSPLPLFGMVIGFGIAVSFMYVSRRSQ